jgi:hypothetical protein
MVVKMMVRSTETPFAIVMAVRLYAKRNHIFYLEVGESSFESF